MKKPKEEIERFRYGRLTAGDSDAILAYLDTLPDWIGEWPADLTRERLEELAYCVGVARAATSVGGLGSTQDALRALAAIERMRTMVMANRALAAIAPQRKKRMVNIWKHENGNWEPWPITISSSDPRWRKVGGPVEIDE